MRLHTPSIVTRVRKANAGLTLIELVVVLFILAALAGIAIASFPGFQKATHGASSANAIRSGQSAIGVRIATGRGLGTDLDGLITDAGLIPDYIDQGTGSLVPTPMDDDVVAALNGLGIDSVFPASAATLATIPGEQNATFNGHDYTSAITIVAGSTDDLAALNAAAVSRAEFDFNLDAGQFDNIFAFGVGEQASLVGANGTFQEAPVHTPGEGSAVEQYGRYVILVGYDAGEVEATYLGLVCIDDGENFNNINRNLGEYLEASE